MSGHAQHKRHTKEYLLVFAALAIFTAIEVGVPEFPLSYFAKASALTLLAVSKAFIVAYYYMHLKEEAAWTRFIAAIPISAVVYTVVVCLESVYR